MTHQPLIFAGSSHGALARKVCHLLQIDLGKIHLGLFPDGEIDVQILEEVHGRDVFVLQTIAGDPNHCFMELLIIIDALKRSSAKSITGIIPYFGYCRQDRKNKSGVPIAAKLVANCLGAAGMTRLMTFDLHADQVEGFFEIPVDHFHCQKLLCESVEDLIGGDCMVVAPDIGSIKIAESMAKLLDTKLAVIKKERLNSYDVVMTLIGDVRNKDIVIPDDLCSTAGTLAAAANLCREQGAKTIIATVTHGLFVGDALKKIESSALDYLMITDTIAQKSPLPEQIKTISVASMIAKVLLNHTNNY